MNFYKAQDFITEQKNFKENTLVIVESENHEDFSDENNLKKFHSACSNKNLNFFYEVKLEWFNKNSFEAENKIIEYFSRLIRKEILQGEEEFFFLQLNDDIKIKIFERITEEN